MGLAFIEEAQAQRIDGNAEGIIVAALGVAVSVGMLGRFEIGRMSVDRRHVSALPMASGRRSEREEIVQHFAGVVFGAPHFDQIGIAGEIARPHLGAGLEAPGAGDDGAGAKIVFVPRGADAHPLDAMHVAVDRADRGRKADLDIPLRGYAAPLFQLAHAAARHMNGDAALEIALVADLGMLLQKLPADS